MRVFFIGWILGRDEVYAVRVSWVFREGTLSVGL